MQEPGKRSQLWRMTGSGMLCHEGSSPPQSKPAQPRPLDSSLVLDIAGLAAVSDNRFVCNYVQLPYQFQFNMLAFINTGDFEETLETRNVRAVFSTFDHYSFEPLMIRRPDSRRSTTQTWYFSSGKLTCGLSRLVVQVGTPRLV